MEASGDFPDFQRLSLSVSLPASFGLVNPEEDTEAKLGLLLLHGYADNARAIYRRALAASALPHFFILAPNALFPMPVREGSGYKEAYSWFFRDLRSGHEMISPELAAVALCELIAKAAPQISRW